MLSPEKLAEFEHLLDNEDSDIQIAVGYAEPGYTFSGEQKGVAMANWNRYEQAFLTWLESRYAIEWGDEWATCEDCDKVFRTQPSGHGWTMYGTLDARGCTCGDCLKKDPEAYLKNFEGKTRRAASVDVNPGEHGYLRVNPEGRSYQHGLHPGMDDNPVVIAKHLEDLGVERFLFVLDAGSQFDVTFLLFIHESEKDHLDAIKAALGFK